MIDDGIMYLTAQEALSFFEDVDPDEISDVDIIDSDTGETYCTAGQTYGESRLLSQGHSVDEFNESTNGFEVSVRHVVESWNRRSHAFLLQDEIDNTVEWFINNTDMSLKSIKRNITEMMSNVDSRSVDVLCESLHDTKFVMQKKMLNESKLMRLISEEMRKHNRHH